MKKSIAILLAIGYQKIMFWHPFRNPYSVIDPKQVLQDIDLKNKFDGHQLVKKVFSFFRLTGYFYKKYKSPLPARGFLFLAAASVADHLPYQ